MVYLKVFVITAIALLISLVSVKLLEPSNAPVMVEYKQKLDELKANPNATAEDKAEIDAMFRHINSKESIQAELIEIVVKNGIFYLLTIPLAWFVARKVSMNNNGVLSAAALMALMFMVCGMVITGALLGAIFAITGLSKNQKALREAAQEA